MISTPSLLKRPKNRLSRFMGFTAALLLASATASFAVTPAESASNNYLGAGITVQTATVDQLRVATLRAITEMDKSSLVLPSAIATTALARIPQFAAEIQGAALARSYVVGTSALIKLTGKTGKATDALLAKENAAIVKVSYTKAFARYFNAKTNASSLATLGNGNTFIEASNKANMAASLAFTGVKQLRDEAKQDPTTLLTPLQTYVTNAVKAAALAKQGTTALVGQQNGAAGFVAGAINDLAGVNNDNIANLENDNAVSGTSNRLIAVILTTAAKNAPKNILDIAQAAGYAFASTYRQTHSGPVAETDGMTFTNNNTAGIVSAIKAGMTLANFNKLGLQVQEQVQAGIARAYLGTKNNMAAGAGSGGVAFPNGVASAVTPVSTP